MAIFNGRNWTIADFVPFNYVKVWDLFWTDVLIELGLRKQAVDDAVDAAEGSATAAAASQAAAAGSASAAAGSATTAGTKATEAAASAAAAAASAAGVNLPAVTVADAGKHLIVNPAGTGYVTSITGTTYWGGTAGGTASSLTATTSASLTSLTRGQIVGVKIGAAANPGAATLAVDGVAAIAIRKDGAALVGGELTANTDRFFQFDGTYWRLLGGAGGAGGAGALWCGVAGGTANVLTLTPAAPLAAYADGAVIAFVTGATENSATVTVAASGLPAVSLLTVSGYALNRGDLRANTLYLATCYNGSFRLQNSTPAAIVTAGLLSRLDAGDSACYSTGQTLNNLVSSPADGSGSAVYSWVRGSSTSVGSDDPTFVGSSGSMSAGEYFSTDGGDCFSLGAASNTAFFDSLHKSGAVGTIAAWLFLGGDTPILGTGDSNAKPYFFFRANPASNYLMFVQGNAASGATVVQSSSAPAAGTWAFVAISLAEAVASGSFFYANGAYLPVSGNNTFTLAYTSPSTATAGRKAALLDYGVTSGFPAASGSRLAQMFLWNRALSKAELDATFAATRSRYGV